MLIRDAQHADLPGILAIHNHAVTTSTAIWNTDTVDLNNRRRWMDERLRAGFPVLVAEGPGGAVLGFASYGAYRPHDGYHLTVEHSVYVSDGARGGGIGGALLSALIERARAAGLHVMVAGIDGANAGSIRLHERLGFRRVGLLPQVGQKFGRWLDLAFLQLTLDDRAAP